MKHVVFSLLFLYGSSVHCFGATDAFIFNATDNIFITKTKLSQASITYSYSSNHLKNFFTNPKFSDKLKRKFQKKKPKQLIRFSGNIFHSSLSDSRSISVNWASIHFNKNNLPTEFTFSVESRKETIELFYHNLLSNRPSPIEFLKEDHTISYKWVSPLQDIIKHESLIYSHPSKKCPNNKYGLMFTAVLKRK